MTTKGVTMKHLLLFVALAVILASLSCGSLVTGIAALPAWEQPAVWHPFLTLYTDDLNHWNVYQHEKEIPYGGCPLCIADSRCASYTIEGRILFAKKWLGMLWTTTRPLNLPEVGNCKAYLYSCSRGHKWITVWTQN